MVQVLELELYLENKLLLKLVMKIQKKLKLLRQEVQPTWLPPQPFLNLGLKARLIYERFRAKV